MKRPRIANPRAWIGATSALAVVLLAVVDVRRTSPGPLTEAHARVPELQGRSGCAECHGGWTESMESACLECHAVIQAHVDLGEGLHGHLPSDLVAQCGRCHSDHHGEGFTVVNLMSFREAGTPDPDAFDHATIGWTMDGAHLELDCAECHANAGVALLPAGEHRFLGLDQDCESCHEDAHEGRMRLACAQCHGQEDFTELRALDHERWLPLSGGHADVACRTCHAEGEPHALEALGQGSRPDVRECRECHADPHDAGFLGAVAERTALAAGAACVTCHAADHATFRDPALTVSDELHALAGFALDAPHAEVACAQCHGPAEAAFDARFPGRGQDACAACHADPHGGQFATGPFSQGCLACHERVAFEPHAFDVEDHARAALALDGAHLETGCEACHVVKAAGAPRAFRGTPSDCDGCHADAHEGFFAPHARALDAAPHGLCAACHRTTSFSELPEGGFDHAAYTRFPLEGAHLQADCETCHPRAAEPDLFGRAFGRAAQRFRADPARFLEVDGCASCHADPHAGQFDAPGLPRKVDGRAGCARCHTTSSFRALVPGWDHRRWTGFALDGAHGRADCTACHAPIAPGRGRQGASDDGRRGAPGGAEVGRTWERAAGDRCADCHAEPHGGQFAIAGSTSCERCHETATAWSDLDFNHERDARFPLGEAHAQVACASCHRPAEEGRGPVIYRPLAMDCASCHGTLEGPSLKRRGR